MAKLPDVDEWARELGKKGAQYVLELLEQEYGVSAARLRELARADRDGRCVVLPCKIGDRLHRISQREYDVYEAVVDRQFISTGNIAIFVHWVFPDGKRRSTSYEVFSNKDIGKTVFLTREEAEAALRREQDG